MLTIEPVATLTLERPDVRGRADRTLFHTPEWLAFLADTQGGEPVVAELREEGVAVGVFTGLVVRRFGVRILGSPFPGWTTESMGFSLEPTVDRREAAALLPGLAFRRMRCLHLEFRDRRTRFGDLDGLGFAESVVGTLEVDLGGAEDAVFGRMTSAARRAVRKAAKSGVTVEEAHDEAFAEDYHRQLRDVFARQGLVPTYGVGRVRSLLAHLTPAGAVLPLRARDADGRCIATALFPASGDTAYFWGGASERSGQILRPNEALFWYAMRYWRGRGMTTLDMGGRGEYKLRYGARPVEIPHFRRSRVAGMGQVRDLARSATRLRQAAARRRGAASL